MIDASILSIITIALTAILGMFGISVALEGYGFNNTGFFYNSDKPKGLIITLDVIERLLFAFAGLLCVIPEQKSDIFGICLLIILIAYQLIVKKVKKLKLTKA